jgi:carboxymethylenebutenolidase
MTSSQVDIATDDGVCDAYLSQPDSPGPHPAVLFWPDAIGVRPRLYDMADKIASWGYVVLLPNIFYRSGRVPLIEGLEELLGQEDRAKLFAALGPVISQFKPADGVRDAEFYLRFLADQPSVAEGPVGLTGYCMGAGMALRTAGAYPDRVAAAGGFHGGNLATDAADSPHLSAKTCRAELYFGHADNDQSMPPDQQARLATALDEAGVTFKAEVYEGALHGYSMADTRVYNEAGEQRHWTALNELFTRVIPPRTT